MLDVDNFITLATIVLLFMLSPVLILYWVALSVVSMVAIASLPYIPTPFSGGREDRRC